MRGFFSGLILGSLVMAGGVAVISLMSPVTPRPEVDANAPQSVTATEATTADAGRDSGVGPAGADADLVEQAPVAPGSDGTAPDDLSSVQPGDTEPAALPDVGNVADGLSQPATAPDAAGVEVQGDAPVAGNAPSDAPLAPAGEGDPTAATGDPAQPAVPEIGESGSGFASVAPTGEASPDIASPSDTAPASENQSGAMASPGSETAPAPSTSPAVRPADNSPPVTAPEQETTTATAPTPDTSPQSPQIAVLPQAGDESGDLQPRIGKKVVPLTERDTQPESAADPVAQVAPDPDAPPLERFAADFVDPGDKPLMSIILIDDDQSIGVEALLDFPYPLTFAIDPTATDAAEKMARHRAAGFEVVAMIDLPKVATAQDAEVALSAGFSTLPEVVAVLEGTNSGFQGNRNLSDQVTAIAAGNGYGLITQDKGLNTVQKLAARAGVPSGVVFRDFDGAGQTPTVMRRFLDQAAFRAGQQGAVIMLGRVRPDTSTALILWGLQDRASQVTLAPISAVLRQQR